MLTKDLDLLENEWGIFGILNHSDMLFTSYSCSKLTLATYISNEYNTVFILQGMFSKTLLELEGSRRLELNCSFALCKEVGQLNE